MMDEKELEMNNVQVSKMVGKNNQEFWKKK